MGGKLLEDSHLSFKAKGLPSPIERLQGLVSNLALIQANFSQKSDQLASAVSGWNGKTWYIAGCVSGAVAIFGGGFCVYWPFVFGVNAHKNDITYEVSWGLVGGDLEFE